MKPERLVVIGGVAGGASAAARARRHSESVRITLVERGPDVSFANCGLPYHIGGEIQDRRELALQTPDSLRQLLNLEVLTGTEAVEVDRDRKVVTVRTLANGDERELPYDALVLSPGAAPLRPPIPGIESPRVLTLRNLQDMDRVAEAVEGAERVAVIGGGFIGLEMAEQLVALDKVVSLVELQAQVLPQMDAEMAQPLAGELRRAGVELILSDGIDAFEEVGDRLRVVLKSGRTIEVEVAVLSIGVRPESGLAKAAGLELGPRGHVRVDAFMRTSDPSIYAVGDVCEAPDPIFGGHAAVPLGGPANRQGRTAADHIFLGERALRYPGSIGTAIVRVFGLAAGMTGATERRLRAEGVDYATVTVNGPSHASYFPGAETITLKLLWAKADGRVLGAQAIGADGVDKRLDILATAIRGELGIEDLAHLELAYAPPFGSAKDVVNIAGFAAMNVRDGLLKPVPDLASAQGQVIDVRPAAAAAKLPVPGAKNIPLVELRQRLGEIDAEKPVFTICQMGKTSYFAARILANHGLDARSILGGAHHQVGR